ncbi:MULTISPECIES: hypothetical protein [unclassified Cryobacterium]|uniref:hypothetical protein n=1 Tax=unclassified Cryobacterium TaxID=2649013 RepID=UPI002AB41F0A|nr:MULTISPECIES: hypothetical protein [unclassified Cryobacterium]MDY7542667.1 hypothetical protein [Cryobacterium sp. 5B3]MEB0264788.1 hypothetical protein [Cryobacterium sp. 10I5]MEB0273760.1 hypothetical protein [Cryobacterium sp. 5B3]
MPYVKRRWFWWAGVLALGAILVGGRLVWAGASGPPLTWADLLIPVAIIGGFAVAVVVLYVVLVRVMGTRRQDAATLAAIQASEPDAVVVYVAQTAVSRRALEALGGNVVFEWAAALAVTSTGISVWQSSRVGKSVRLFDLRWSDIRDVRLVMTAIFGSTTPTLQLSFVTKGDRSVVVPLIVRRGFGSVIGLGHGRHIEGVEAKVQDLRGARD